MLCNSLNDKHTLQRYLIVRYLLFYLVLHAQVGINTTPSELSISKALCYPEMGLIDQ